jgi:hypothetical protein
MATTPTRRCACARRSSRSSTATPEASFVSIASRGFEGVDGCLLTAQLGDSDLGVVPIDSGDRAFRCVLDAAGWRHVFDLLETFTTGDLTPGRHAHQYLTETGAIEWIVSTNREW